MAIRNEKFLTPTENNAVVEYCRSEKFADSSDLMKCCEESNSQIAKWLYKSIIEPISYEKLDVPLDRSAYYAYRRKALKLFKELKEKEWQMSEQMNISSFIK